MDLRAATYSSSGVRIGTTSQESLSILVIFIRLNCSSSGALSRTTTMILCLARENLKRTVSYALG